MAEPVRISIPLMMLEGNLECLLENEVPCYSISLKHHGPAGVVLTIKQTTEQKKEARELGFTTIVVSPDD